MKSLQSIAIAVITVLALGFLLFLVNQISGIYLLIKDFNPQLAMVLVLILGVLSLILLLSPFYLFWKLPRSLKRPENEDQVAKYQQKLLKRLQSNYHLKKEGVFPEITEQLDDALQVLNEKANRITRDTAGTVFLTTAISQNGKLDAFTVLATQISMIWKIAHLYHQRPSLRDLVYLYANVGATSFLVSEIEDLDVTQHLEPAINGLIKNASGRALPVVGPTATLVMDSVLEGSTNALLTLRIGIITRKYCGNYTVWNASQAKKAALFEAAKQLKSITMDSSGKIITGLVKATRNVGVDTIKQSWENIKAKGNTVVDRVAGKRKKTASPENQS
jgi:hypothetical protein